MRRPPDWLFNRGVLAPSAEPEPTVKPGRVRLLEVVIPCLRYQRTRTFYGDLLGMTCSEEGRNHVFYDLGPGARLALVNAERGDTIVRPTGHAMYVDLSVEDLKAFIARCDARGVGLLDERDDKFGWAVTLRDPEGNLVNVFQEHSY